MHSKAQIRLINLLYFNHSISVGKIYHRFSYLKNLHIFLTEMATNQLQIPSQRKRKGRQQKGQGEVETKTDCRVLSIPNTSGGVSRYKPLPDEHQNLK